MSIFRESAIRNAEKYSDDEALSLAMAASAELFRKEEMDRSQQHSHQECCKEKELETIQQNIIELVSDYEVGARNLISEMVLGSKNFYRQMPWIAGDPVSHMEAQMYHRLCDRMDEMFDADEERYNQEIENTMKFIVDRSTRLWDLRIR